MSADLDHEIDSGTHIYAVQRQLLPRWWAAFDVFIVLVTRWVLFAIGSLFCIFIFLEVASRYLFSFSIFFVNSGAETLLPWFFFLGAGLALRDGAHMSITLLIDMLPPRLRKAAVLFGGVLSGVFLVMIFLSSFSLLATGWQMVEPSLGISLAWGFLSLPISFGLLCYHLLTLMTIELLRPERQEASAA